MWNIELLGVQNGLRGEAILKFPYGCLFPYDLIMLIYNFRIEIYIRMVISIRIDITGRSSTWLRDVNRR